MNASTEQVEDGVMLISYDTYVAHINTKENVVTLYMNWDFGPTTIKHVMTFISDTFGCVKPSIAQLRESIVSGKLYHIKVTTDYSVGPVQHVYGVHEFKFTK